MHRQAHLGCAVWDRGNVFLGLYGAWHGGTCDGDRQRMQMDLGEPGRSLYLFELKRTERARLCLTGKRWGLHRADHLQRWYALA